MYAGNQNITPSYYTTLRTLSTATTDTVPPLSTSFAVSTLRTMFADVLIVGSAVAGTIACDSITWKIWRLIGTTIEQVDQFDMDAADITAPVTRTVPSGVEKLWITATLNGGSSPNVSAVVSIRPLVDGSMTQSKLSTDPQGYVYNRNISYDAPSNADKTVLVRDTSDQYVQETLAILSGTAVIAADYDIDMRSYTDLSLVIYGQSDTSATNLVNLTIQQCNDTTVTTPRYAAITKNMTDATTGAAVACDGYGVFALPTAAADTYCWVLKDSCAERVRVHVTLAASTDADNKLEIFSYKKGKQ
jgi:hypothetical protein